MAHSLPSSKKTLRREMRSRRRALTPVEQHQASAALVRQLLSFPWFSCARRIGLYLAADGEIDPQPLTLARALRYSRFYVPTLIPVRRPRRLQFAALHDRNYRPVSTSINSLNIIEPKRNEERRVWPSDLDVLLMPLVAFDRRGNRMGMGGGFYDRTLMVRAACRHLMRPKLVGVAHHFQQVDALPVEPWDVPLQAIVTDRHSEVFGAI